MLLKHALRRYINSIFRQKYHPEKLHQENFKNLESTFQKVDHEYV